MSVNLSPVAGAAAQFLDNSGNVLTGGKLYTYAAGTTTPQATYTSGAGVIFHSNPIILDAAGRVPNGGEIWLSDGLQYKFVLKDANDVLLGTWDNLIGINSNFINYNAQEEIQVATAGQTVFTLSTVTYQPGTNTLSVFVDGVNQYDGISYAYVETDSTTVTFTSGLHVGALVKFTTAVTLSSGVTDSSLVVYDPPFTGSVPTTVELKLAQTISVKDFGAVGDGVTDDTAAIQAAFDYASSLNNGVVTGVSGEIYSCGQINALCGVSFNGNNCDILSTSASWLLFSSGISYSISTVENVRIKASLTPTLGSVGIGFTSSAYTTRKQLSVSNVIFLGSNGSPTTYGYEKYINLVNASYSQIINVEIDGCFDPLKTGPGPGAQFVSYGIYLDGQTVGTLISHCRLQALHTAVRSATTQQEGTQISTTEAVAVRDGFDFSVPSLGGPGVWLVNTHANASRCSFNVTYRPDVSFTGCSAYKSPTLYSEDWVGFDLSHVFSAKISTAEILYNDLTYPNSKGFLLLNSQGVSAAAINIRQTKIALSHEGNCTGCSWDAITFIGNGAYCDTAIATTNTDSKIKLGDHNLMEPWSNPYDIVTFKNSINIKRNVQFYSDVVKRTVSAAGTLTLVTNSDSSPQMQFIVLAAGSGPYDYTVELSLADALQGDYFDFTVVLPSNINYRIIFVNGVGGTTLGTLSTATSKRYSARFYFTGVQWETAWATECVFI